MKCPNESVQSPLAAAAVVTPHCNNDNNSISSDKEVGFSVWSRSKLIMMGQYPSIMNEELRKEDFPEILASEGSDVEITFRRDDALPSSASEGSVLDITIEIDDELFDPNARGEKDNGLVSTDIVDSNNAIRKFLGRSGEESSVADDSVDFLKDNLCDMTWSRRIALFLMKRYSWYNPSLNNQMRRTGIYDHSFHMPHASENKMGRNTMLDKLTDCDPLLDESGRTADSALQNKLDIILNDAYPFSHSYKENPSLEKAWAFFEHVALPRHMVEPNSGSKQLQKAQSGEKRLKTALYHPIFTPHNQLGDFGIGIGLYFSTLRGLAVMTILAGFINSVNFKYFSSDKYNNPTNVAVRDSVLNFFVRGSAICTDTSWVPCSDCNNSNKDNFAERRFAYGHNIETDNSMIFYLRNNCKGTSIEQAMVNYATLLWIVIGIIVVNQYSVRMEKIYDEDEQTARDYSVVIQNPPPDATDPQEWHDFFKEAFGAHVTACTVAVDNDLLVRTLVARREVLRKIDLAFEPGTSLDILTIARIATKKELDRGLVASLIAKIVPGIPELFAKLTVLTSKVQGLAQQPYPATHVFLTFETEKAQRDVLQAYSLGVLDVKRNRAVALKDPNKHLFRGKLVLKVREPDEPCAVRWQDLNVKFVERLKPRVITAICTLTAIFSISLFLRFMNEQDWGKNATAYTIALFNFAFPHFARSLTLIEAHSSESQRQRSLYSKVALFRLINTAILITIITPFTYTISNNELIDQISALFLAEIVITNAFQLADPLGHLRRHILAPRARTQDAMNVNMLGQRFDWADKYTSMTKILFLALWYSAIYPGALFLCSVTLTITYFTDRFSLMRTWKRAPQLGNKMSRFSITFFFALAVVAMALASSYFWACFPFDNLCETDTLIDSEYLGSWSINGTIVRFQETDRMYKFCLQDFFRFPKYDKGFPFVPSMQIEGQEWMTPDQEIVTKVYGSTAVAVIALVFLFFVWQGYCLFMNLFRGKYRPCGKVMGINFSDVPSITTYVPQITSKIFSYPLLACNIDKFDVDLLDWTDPDRPHSHYDLTKDARVVLRGLDFGNNVVFSQIAHWPPCRKVKRKISRDF